jgi:hypothetical protein
VRRGTYVGDTNAISLPPPSNPNDFVHHARLARPRPQPCNTMPHRQLLLSAIPALSLHPERHPRSHSLLQVSCHAVKWRVSMHKQASVTNTSPNVAWVAATAPVCVVAASASASGKSGGALDAAAQTHKPTHNNKGHIFAKLSLAAATTSMQTTQVSVSAITPSCRDHCSTVWWPRCCRQLPWENGVAAAAPRMVPGACKLSATRCRCACWPQRPPSKPCAAAAAQCARLSCQPPMTGAISYHTPMRLQALDAKVAFYQMPPVCRPTP